MKKSNIKKMALAALFAALVCISTMIILVNFPNGGYIHLGDCFVLVAGWVMGPLWGGAAAAIGSALTDLIVGAPHYIPATFIIKGLVAAAAYYVMKAVRFGGRGAGILRYIISGVVGELIMVVGYFFYGWVLYDFAGALAGIPFNLIQGGAGILLSSVLINPLMKIKYVRELSGRCE